MAKLINFVTEIDLSDYTLIIPSVSVANVPQLTVDLLISTHNLKKVATIWHPAIVPSVGGDAFTIDSEEISTACELYASEELKVAVIQLRSSIVRNLVTDFFNKLKQSIQNLQFKNVIILSSSFAYELHDINSGHFRYISNNNNEVFKTLNIATVEPTDGGRYVIFGSGYCIRLYELLNVDVNCTVLIKYSSEGDNRPDSLQMLEIIHKIVKNFKQCNLNTVKFPSSWDFVFGNPPPVGIY